MANTRSPKGLVLLLMVVSTASLKAQECPCCGPPYALFDFWIGEWIVYDSLDQVVGTNRIEKAQKGCLLIEHWTAAGNSTGTSYNYYLAKDSTWNQVWVDDQGGVLQLKGRIREEAMVLRSAPFEGQDRALLHHQITWKKVNDEVIQTWEILNASKQVIRVLFQGYYRKK